MLNRLYYLLLAACIGGVMSVTAAVSAVSSAWDFSFTDITGNKMPLAKYEGQVLLVGIQLLVVGSPRNMTRCRACGRPIRVTGWSLSVCRLMILAAKSCLLKLRSNNSVK